MSLEKYVAKRDFTKTAEPKAGRSKDKNKLMFVVQKHDATRLHYDFRLEMEGVLKSWAVPKGPSTDPENKRLAMMVEDHPFDYRNFEGIIPKGEYGGGTVIVWDQGTYEPIEAIKGKAAQEKHLLAQLKAGSLKIKLHGEKLEGEYALVKTHGMGENGWLMIKHKDGFASTKDITLKDKSVLSGKTIAKMEKTSEKVWQHGHEEDVKEGETKENASTKKTPAKKSAAKKTVTKKVASKKAPGKTAAGKKKLTEDPDEALAEVVAEAAPEPIDVTTLLKKAPKTKIPTGIKPMKATLVDEPFDDPDWVYEVKWDGYRAIATINKGKAELVSRNNLVFDKYYPINKLMESWKINAVLDGEILVLNNKGTADFGALQNWRSEADGDLAFYVFDILWYEGKSLADFPLLERQAILQEVLPADDGRIRQSKVFNAGGIEFFNAAEQMGLEGIIAKKADSVYTSDLRSKEWLKIKVHKRQEVVIAGFTKNDGTAKSFSALVMGVYEGKKLKYVGKVGTGFSDKLQKEMMTQFEPLITDKSPFDVEPDVDKPSRFRPKRMGAKPTWLKPKLVCEVAFAEVTSDGVFRQASFQGMREDKNPKDIIMEKEKDTDETVAAAEAELPKEKTSKIPVKKAAKTAVTGKSKIAEKTSAGIKAIKPLKDSGKKTLLNPKDETQTREICGHELKFTHLSKEYWPEDHITKRDMFNYYYQVADYILPYLKDRPMSLNRFPNGIHGPSFYQKDIKGKAPEWVSKTFPYTTSEGEDKEYLVGSDEAVLMWMASLACIEMNPWFSRVQSPDNPDYCVIDLDPDKKKTTFEQVITAAQETKKVLDTLDVPSFCKTSGSTGIHIYIPLAAEYSYDQSQMFARLVVNIVHNVIPDFTSLERSVSARKGKMYLDFLQNRPGATIAGPYSLRPKPGATVSMPLHWDEVKKGLKMKDFTIFNAIDRLKETGDLFKPVLGKGIDLDKTLERAEREYKL